MSAARTRAACMASAERLLTAPPRHREPLDLRDLVGKTVARIEPYRFGWRMRFSDGTAICVNEGHTFDNAGDFVKEPE